MPLSTVRTGVLVAVDRTGRRLSVTIRHEGLDYVIRLYEWTSPPTMDEVEATLKANVGRIMRDVGEAEVRPAPLDEFGF
jgi:hypothetical protein